MVPVCMPVLVSCQYRIFHRFMFYHVPAGRVCTLTWVNFVTKVLLHIGSDTTAVSSCSSRRHPGQSIFTTYHSVCPCGGEFIGIPEPQQHACSDLVLEKYKYGKYDVEYGWRIC